MEQLRIIKIGGKVIDDKEALKQFLDDFSRIDGNKILVHGGGKIASDFGERLGIQPKMLEGRRITDAETLDLVTMVYGGLVNKKIVAGLQAFGVNALGLTGADGNVLSAVKRPVRTVDYGFAGDTSKEDVNTSLLADWINTGLTPVFCALTHDKKGSLLNTNADTIASVLASALAAHFKVQLIYCFEQLGVLRDFETKEVIDTIDSNDYQALKEEGVISDGMIPKIDNAFAAIENDVEEVRIGHFSTVNEMALMQEVGTKITK